MSHTAPYPAPQAYPAPQQNPGQHSSPYAPQAYPAPQQNPGQYSSPYAPQSYPQQQNPGQFTSPYAAQGYAQQPGQPYPAAMGYTQQSAYTAQPVYSQPIHTSFQQPQVPYGAAIPFYASSVPPLTEHEVHQDCEKLRKAMKGIGTDEKAIISVLGSRNPDQSAQISQGYFKLCKKTLVDVLDSETSGDFRNLCKALTYSLAEYDARILQEAMKGLGTNESLVIQILVGRTNAEINAIKQKYSEEFKKDLESQIKNETSGDFEKLLVALLSANRDETSFNPSTIESDIAELYKAGEGRLGTRESTFIRIFASRPENHLREVFKGYLAKHKKTMEDVINNEFSGDIKKLMIAIVRSVNDRPMFIANLFEEAMKGHGTNDDQLIRLVVRHRDPRVMGAIKQAYQTRFGRSLCERVKGETSGDYEKLLVELIKP